MNEIETLNQLLKDSKEIIKKFEYKGGILDLFTLFSVKRRELGHSAVISELLNRNGSHKQGTKYLDILLGMLGFEELDSAKCIVEVEKSIEEYGRIDILVSDNKNALMIENKVDAQDMDKQLYRYHQYCRSRFPNGKLKIVYLTLDGHSPCEDSLNNKKECELNVICASYRSLIVDWLTSCISSITADVDLNLKNSLTEYLKVIQSLTNQGEEKIMYNKLAENIMSTDEYMETYNNLINAESAIIEKVACEFLNKLKSNCPNGFKVLSDNFNITDGSGWIGLSNDAFAKSNMIICIEFNAKNFKSPTIGIAKLVNENEVEQKWRDAIVNRFGESSNDIWPYVKTVSEGGWYNLHKNSTNYINDMCELADETTKITKTF